MTFSGVTTPVTNHMIREEMKMTTFNTLSVTAIAAMVSITVWANTSAHENNQAEMSMTNDGQDKPMMESQMTMKAQADDHKMQHHHMSMMGEGGHGMMMDPHMMGHHQHHYKSVMDGGKGDMMNPEMMQKSQQHMENMEQRLASIEALLIKLVELQKP